MTHKVKRRGSGEFTQYEITVGTDLYIVAKLSYGWEVWTGEQTNDNCWACGFRTKKEAINAILSL